jgi:aryl-alcohol dehydrogenase-like predicted oxidoreductase
MAWLLSKDAVTAPITGATRTQHLDHAVAALTIRLDQQEIAQLEAPYLPRLLSDYS